MAKAGKQAIFPNWGQDAAVLARTMIAEGFPAAPPTSRPHIADR